jgi:hypothetical protein
MKQIYYITFLCNRWYERLDPSLPEAKKIEIAKQNLTTWLGTMVHTVSLLYNFEVFQLKEFLCFKLALKIQMCV